MVVASNSLVSILVVRVLCPYSQVRDVFRVSWMFLASSCDSAFELASRLTCRLYFGWF